MVRQNAPIRNSDQSTINSLLWRIVRSQGGKVRLRYSELTNMPDRAGLEVDNVPGTEFVEVKAVINSPVAMPLKRIIT